VLSCHCRSFSFAFSPALSGSYRSQKNEPTDWLAPCRLLLTEVKSCTKYASEAAFVRRTIHDAGNSTHAHCPCLKKSISGEEATIDYDQSAQFIGQRCAKQSIHFQ